jgi:hypothetical protein
MRIVVPLLIVLVLGGGLFIWWQRTDPPAPPGAVPELPAGAVERALAAATADSLALKTRWVDEVPGIDLLALAREQREVFLRFVNARSCTCGCGYTLGACRNFDPTCEVSGPLIAALFDSVAAGRITSVAGLRERPGAALE